MRIVVDRDRCTGLGMCEAEAPDLFEVQDDGTLKGWNRPSWPARPRRCRWSRTEGVSERFVVVGGSLAGLRAVQAARRAGFTGPLTLVGGEAHLPYDRPPLSKEYLRAGEEGAADTTFRTEQELRGELDVDLRMGAWATGLGPGAPGRGRG